MADKIRAMAAQTAGGKLETYEFDPGDLGPRQVEVAVETCGICHSDLSMLNNDWGQSRYPLVAGHEAVGRVVSVGSEVRERQVGQLVGVGWYSGSCMSCPQCMRGDHNLCRNAEQTIVRRHGGFATRVHCNAEWATPLVEGVEATAAGPLFCGGITVFNPIVQCNVKPTDKVAVIGIGGLGHLALQFLNKWGCDVTAFTSSDSKAEEAKSLGAHHVVNSRQPGALKELEGKFDFILNTTNVTLDWPSYFSALAPRGRFHTVGAVLEPMQVAAFNLIGAQRSVSGSPLGSPATTATMLEFCARHGIAPQTEVFPMSQVNEALEHLESGKARYRIVLTNDLG